MEFPTDGICRASHCCIWLELILEKVVQASGLKMSYYEEAAAYILFFEQDPSSKDTLTPIGLSKRIIHVAGKQHR